MINEGTVHYCDFKYFKFEVLIFYLFYNSDSMLVGDNNTFYGDNIFPT